MCVSGSTRTAVMKSGRSCKNKRRPQGAEFSKLSVPFFSLTHYLRPDYLPLSYGDTQKFYLVRRSKKMIRIMVFALLLFMVSCAVALAGENEMDQDDNLDYSQRAGEVEETRELSDVLSVTLGMKAWQTTAGFNVSTDEENKNVKAKALMYGPAANFTILNTYYIGASFYTGSGFDFSDGRYDYTATKSDIDGWVGWIFHPRSSLFLGYKYSETSFDHEDEAFKYTDVRTFRGIVLGLNGNLPIMDSGFILTGTAGLALLDLISEKYTGENTTSSAFGPALELTLAYIYHKIPHLSLACGYKYQNYKVTDESFSKGKDYLTFYGLTAVISYRFNIF